MKDEVHAMCMEIGSRKVGVKETELEKG